MAGSLVAGEADVTHLAGLLGFVQRLDHPALGEVPLRVVVVDALVDLPQVEVVGLQSLQRLVELPQGDLLVAAVGADLGHQEDLVAPTLEGLAHPLLALAVVVLPGVVEEVDAGIDRLVDDGDGFLEGRGVAQAVAAQPDDGDRLLGPPERFARDPVGSGVAQLESGRRLGPERGTGHGQSRADQAGGLQEVTAVGAVRVHLVAVIVHDGSSCRAGRVDPPTAAATGRRPP